MLGGLEFCLLKAILLLAFPESHVNKLDAWGKGHDDTSNDNDVYYLIGSVELENANQNGGLYMSFI